MKVDVGVARDMWAMDPFDAQYLADYVKDNFPNVKNVLDLGTGKGVFVDACMRANLNAYGVDIRDIYRYERARVIRTDARMLPFVNASFDLVHESLMTLDMRDLQKQEWGEVEKVINESYRILKLGGIYIGTSFCAVGGLLEKRGFEILSPDITLTIARKIDTMHH